MAPSSFRRLALAGVVALLVGGAPLAQAPEPAQDDSIDIESLRDVESVRTRANAGDAEAQHLLGLYYEFTESKGQDLDRRRLSYAEAMAWYRKAAEQGYVASAKRLGDWYGYALGGVAQDYAEAVVWYRQAAEQGNVDAQADLGFWYTYGRGYGRGSVAQDYIKASVWLRKAAEQGNVISMQSLAGAYSVGSGVPPDVVEEYKWWNLAATYTDRSVTRDMYSSNRDNLARRLTREQIAEGQRRAREFFEAHPPE